MTTETTEYNIFVRTSDDVILDWDRTRIAEALIRETDLDNPIAHDIAQEVEQMLIRSGTKTVTSPSSVSSSTRSSSNAAWRKRGLATRDSACPSTTWRT